LRVRSNALSEKEDDVAVNPVPPGFHTVTPYLIVAGAQQLIDFLTSAFGAELIHCSRRADGAVWHAQMKIGDSMIMLSDANEQFKAMPTTINLYLPDVDAVHAQAVKAGGRSVMEPATQFYGDRSSGVQDACGNFWWISTHVEDVSEEELKRRTEAAAAAASQQQAATS
jgi:uncharacterized glyoxalase superfamily protein PhnB